MKKYLVPALLFIFLLFSISSSVFAQNAQECRRVAEALCTHSNAAASSASTGTNLLGVPTSSCPANLATEYISSYAGSCDSAQVEIPHPSGFSQSCEQSFTVARWNGAQWSDANIQIVGRDFQENKIIFTIPAEGIYAVLRPQACQPPSEAATSCPQEGFIVSPSTTVSPGQTVSVTLCNLPFQAQQQPQQTSLELYVSESIADIGSQVGLQIKARGLQGGLNGKTVSWSVCDATLDIHCALAAQSQEVLGTDAQRPWQFLESGQIASLPITLEGETASSGISGNRLVVPLAKNTVAKLTATIDGETSNQLLVAIRRNRVFSLGLRGEELPGLASVDQVGYFDDAGITSIVVFGTEIGSGQKIVRGIPRQGDQTTLPLEEFLESIQGQPALQRVDVAEVVFIDPVATIPHIILMQNTLEGPRFWIKRPNGLKTSGLLRCGTPELPVEVNDFGYIVGVRSADENNDGKEEILRIRYAPRPDQFPEPIPVVQQVAISGNIPPDSSDMLGTGGGHGEGSTQLPSGETVSLGQGTIDEQGNLHLPIISNFEYSTGNLRFFQTLSPSTNEIEHSPSRSVSFPPSQEDDIIIDVNTLSPSRFYYIEACLTKEDGVIICNACYPEYPEGRPGFQCLNQRTEGFTAR